MSETKSVRIRTRATENKDAGSDGPTYLTPAPLIEGEDIEEFEEFQQACFSAIGPKDVIEEVWLGDFVNYTWEAKRLREIKVGLMSTKRLDGASRILQKFTPLGRFGLEEFGDLSENENGSRVEAAKEVLAEHDLPEVSMIAEGFLGSFQQLETLDKLIASYDFRRDKALTELEKRRESLARKARAYAEKIEDADFEEL
ncbi:hypothetical protein RYZ26_18695 [Terasakiella sp. A23]|uniref:hypothetical protein n=1 Tax=Terasakiella sp. FCG-A23 TaxID=3080561 RepID=UPI0029558F32|nr:hypothetical protein [Terasakiella sp. A23]MDV7341636.1 hypothetical protein [Terasakiella sp. A23]